jgi:hypothetical protein
MNKHFQTFELPKIKFSAFVGSAGIAINQVANAW